MTAKLTDISLAGFVAFIKAQPEARKILKMDSGCMDDMFGDYTQDLFGSRTLCFEVHQRLYEEVLTLPESDETRGLLFRLKYHKESGAFPTYGVLQMCFPVLFKS